MPRDKLKLINVSGRNNNCFFNSLYVIVKNNETFKQLFVDDTNGNAIRNGSQLRKYICELLVHRGYNRFREYLVMAKSLLTAYSNNKSKLLKMHDKLTDVAQLLSVNNIEVISLIEADILTTNVATKDGIQRVLIKHLPTTDRMPSMPEIELSIQIIKDVFNIIVLPIILQRRVRQNERHRSMSLINKYNYGKKRMAYGDDILRTMKIDIKDANVVNKIRIRIGDKFDEMYRKKGSSRMFNNANKYTYAALITDQVHYQVLSLNGMSAIKYRPSNFDDLSMFIFSSDNSFSFSQESYRSPPTYAEGLKM